MRAVGGVQGTADSTAAELGSLQSQTSRGFASTEDAATASQQTFTDQLNRVRFALEDFAPALDQETRTNYRELVSSFDVNGGLIPSGIDAQGNTITRRMNDGILAVSRQDAVGRPVGALQLDVRQMLDTAKQFEQQLPYSQTR